MEDAVAVIILRQGHDADRALELLQPLGLTKLDTDVVDRALRAVHPDPVVPEVFVVDGADQSAAVVSAEDFLTPREFEMLELIASGLSNQQMADHLFLSLNSIKSYIRNAYRKIGVDTRSQAVIWWFEHQASSHQGTGAVANH